MLELFFNNLTQIIGIILFIIFIFILGREFVLWYLKINTRIENQNRIIFLLEKLAGKTTKNEKVLNVLLSDEKEPETKSPLYDPALELNNNTTSTQLNPKTCSQCGEIITDNFPIIITEQGKTKYFCSDECRLSNLEL